MNIQTLLLSSMVLLCSLSWVYGVNVYNASFSGSKHDGAARGSRASLEGMAAFDTKCIMEIHDHMLQDIDKLDALLKERRLVFAEIEQARELMKKMLVDPAWRDIKKSRETAKRENAYNKLRQYALDAQKLLVTPEKKLDVLLAVEKQNWADANPVAAQQLKTADAAVIAAQNAEWRARQAQEDAATAKRKAEENEAQLRFQAQMRVEEANRKVKQSEAVQQRQRDTLWRNGINSEF